MLTAYPYRQSKPYYNKCSGKKESNIKLSSLVDSIYYIPLETKDEFLIGNIDKLIVTDKEIYVLDKNITTATYCFDQKVSLSER